MKPHIVRLGGFYGQLVILYVVPAYIHIVTVIGHKVHRRFRFYLCLFIDGIRVDIAVCR